MPGWHCDGAARRTQEAAEGPGGPPRPAWGPHCRPVDLWRWCPPVQAQQWGRGGVRPQGHAIPGSSPFPGTRGRHGPASPLPSRGLVSSPWWWRWGDRGCRCSRASGMPSVLGAQGLAPAWPQQEELWALGLSSHGSLDAHPHGARWSTLTCAPIFPGCCLPPRATRLWVPGLRAPCTPDALWHGWVALTRDALALGGSKSNRGKFEVLGSSPHGPCPALSRSWPRLWCLTYLSPCSRDRERLEKQLREWGAPPELLATLVHPCSLPRVWV